jgi:hypothetical protein
MFKSSEYTNVALSKPSDIELIATKLFISDDNSLKVTDEWKMLSMDQSIDSLSYKRVDHFWREGFSQTTSNDWRKYSTCVLKMAWSLPHGNADVERGLSLNNSIVTKERNQLNEAVINGLKAKDAVKFYDLELMRPEKLLMTEHVLSSARNAHFDYQRRGELQKEKEEK